MGPGLALHALLATGHGKQPATKKQAAPGLPNPAGGDPRMGALLTLLQSQANPTPPSQNPAPNGPRNKPNFPTKRIISRPTDGQAEL